MTKTLAEKLNEILHLWTYRKLWDWAVMEDVAGAISVSFYFPADNANRQTAHLRPKDLEFRLDDPFISARPTQELVMDAIPGRRGVGVSRELAELMVKNAGHAQGWLEQQLLDIERHEFREFFRHRKTGKPVIDPHPEYAKEREERETLGVVK